MRKTIAILISIVFILSFVACSSSRKYETVEVSGYDNSSVAVRHNDLDLDIETYSKVITSNKTVTINGDTVTGKYTKSQKGYLYHSDWDYYEYLGKDKHVRFAIDSATGVVVSYSCVEMDYVSQKDNATVLSEDQCLEIARQYLNQYVDASAYEKINVNYLEIPEYGAIYDFEFVRFADDIKTSDNAFIGVTIFGDVISHLFGTLNEMKDAPRLSAKDFEVIASNIDAKIKSIFDTVKIEFEYSYSITDKIYVKLSDGTYALEYYISVSLISQNLAGKEKTEFVKLLVYLN